MRELGNGLPPVSGRRCRRKKKKQEKMREREGGEEKRFSPGIAEGIARMAFAKDRRGGQGRESARRAAETEKSNERAGEGEKSGRWS